MIDQTIQKIEERIRQTRAIPKPQRDELANLLATLKGEIGQLAETHQEEAKSITGFTQVSAHEATRQGRNPDLLRLALDGLASSTKGFERSHPDLVDVINRICVALSSLGI